MTCDSLDCHSDHFIAPPFYTYAYDAHVIYYICAGVITPSVKPFRLYLLFPRSGYMRTRTYTFL